MRTLIVVRSCGAEIPASPGTAECLTRCYAPRGPDYPYLGVRVGWQGGQCRETPRHTRHLSGMASQGNEPTKKITLTLPIEEAGAGSASAATRCPEG